jgi:hypothetical protein
VVATGDDTSAGAASGMLVEDVDTFAEVGDEKASTDCT